MCQYCEEIEVWEAPWDPEDEDEHYQCEWIEESEDEAETGALDDDELEERRCPEQASQAIAERYVDEHLCAEHREAAERDLEAGLTELTDSSELQEECEFLPIPTGPDACEYINPLEMLGTGGDQTECGRPAAFAKRIVATSLLCAAHATEASAVPED